VSPSLKSWAELHGEEHEEPVTDFVELCATCEDTGCCGRDAPDEEERCEGYHARGRTYTMVPYGGIETDNMVPRGD